MLALLMPWDSIESKDDIRGMARVFSAIFKGLRTLVGLVHLGKALSSGKPQSSPPEIES